jgi:hypothetical protein
MPYPDLQDELTNDPLGRGYDSMTPAEVASDLQSEHRTLIEPLNSRVLLRKTAELGIITPLEEEAETGNAGVQDIAKAAVRMIKRPDVDLDLADPEEEALVDQLVENSVIAQSDKDALVSEAERSASRAEELGREGKRLPSPIIAQHIETIRS